MDDKGVKPKEGQTANIINALDARFKHHLAILDKFNASHDESDSRVDSRFRNPLKRDSARMNDEVPTATLIVLTDGLWPNEREDFKNLFQEYTNQLQHKGCAILPKMRPYSVELVQFGENQAATELLEYLDDGLQDIP